MDGAERQLFKMAHAPDQKSWWLFPIRDHVTGIPSSLPTEVGLGLRSPDVERNYDDDGGGDDDDDDDNDDDGGGDDDDDDFYYRKKIFVVGCNTEQKTMETHHERFRMIRWKIPSRILTENSPCSPIDQQSNDVSESLTAVETDEYELITR